MKIHTHLISIIGFLVVLISSFYSSSALAIPDPAICGTSYTLPHNTWRQITLPCKAPDGESTLADILGDDLPGTQGVHWAVYRYNTTTESYDSVNLTDTLNPKEGYWVAQVTGVTVLLDMPDNSQPVPLITPSTYCSDAGGCVEHSLAENANAVQWQMIGFPFPGSFPLSKLRIVASSCTNPEGCTLQESAANNLLHDTFWSYNGADYLAVTGNQRISPWYGYWAATLANASTEKPMLQVPSSSFGGDGDADTIEDGVDNCPTIANVDQTNTDTDALGNACDADDDNDTLSDVDEINAGTDPLKADTDDDNVADNLDQFPKDSTRAASEESAHRVLTQASYGATLDEIKRIVRIGTDAWIESELAKPSAYDSSSDTHLTHLERTLQIAIAAEPNTNWYGTAIFNQSTADSSVDEYQMATWWENAIGLHPTNQAHGSDQLRQRIAYALSQILVVSNGESPLNSRGEALSAYYDILAKHAFGNFRDLLGEVARSPAMGIYLSHQGNRKANPATGTRPDENFAREIMQLFTIGLYQLNVDGSANRDGNPMSYPDTGTALVPTYSQEDIEEMSKVMTGWDLVANNRYGRRSNRTGDYTQPMEFTPSEHEDEVAAGGDGLVTILGQTFALNSGTDQSGMDAALDILFNHPNLGPFISRHLIMRLVTSNPSSAYIARVASVFNNNGQGIRGDLKSTVRAILKDPEARGDSYKTTPGFGKTKEPILAWTQLLRAFNAVPLDGWTGQDRATPVSGVYWYKNPQRQFAQAPLRANHVFNFYSPDFIPSDSYFVSNKLVSPEVQIQTEQILLEFNNRVYSQLLNYEKNRITVERGQTLSEYASTRSYWNDQIIIDFTPQLELFEQVLDGDTNGDFVNMEKTDTDGVRFRSKAIDALITHLDLLLLGNTMTPEFRSGLHHYLTDAAGIRHSNDFKEARNIIREAVRFIVTSSSYMIQK